MPPDFLYFDLGNVLLYFDHQRAARQMAAVAGLDAARVWEIVFESGLELRYEAGEISTEEFYETFCRQTGKRPDFDTLALAASDIFEVNLSIKPVLAALAAAGHRLGLLSNTNPIHWEFLSGGRYGLIPDVFEQIVLSYEIKAVKPDPRIFRHAAERAGVEPARICYIDDISGHISAAKALGFDAIVYSSTPELVGQLQARGMRFNY